MKTKNITLLSKVSVDFHEMMSDDDDATTDVIELVGSVGHEEYPFYLDWSDNSWSINLKSYLVKTFGEKIKKYDAFILISC